MGTLYYGDNLDILRRYQDDETVDLVHLDPLFNSAQNYNAFFHEKRGTSTPAAGFARKALGFSTRIRKAAVS
jgi:site-specific DNA-methyltransferase (adenine-specific)